MVAQKNNGRFILSVVVTTGIMAALYFSAKDKNEKKSGFGLADIQDKFDKENSEKLSKIQDAWNKRHL